MNKIRIGVVLLGLLLTATVVLAKDKPVYKFKIKIEK